MKAIMVMFDSLNRRLMQPYGGDWVHTPNFARLAERAVTFENAFIGSMPCMPARRELHTGRYNFLHRSWGPLEPFDDSMPQILDENGVHSHIVTDHQHYWEDGGATYHTRYTTHEFVRGQEGDPWKGVVDAGVARDPNRNFRTRLQDQVNRDFISEEALMPQAQTFSKGLDFIRANAEADEWYLQIETFDPHEPFFTQPGWKEQYPHEYDGELFDWPPYERITETMDKVQHMRYEYAALMTMCDHYLGKVLDVMDELNLSPVFREIAMAPRGLVLVTGPTGSGKSTTLAALIDCINANRREHILSIEDPIEFVHASRSCLVTQREVLRDTAGFNAALRSALREDPDVILVGEMRDTETIRLALTAAETGHLVFGTLHTASAAKTVDRIVDAFPAGEKNMVRSALSESLHAVVSQTLLKAAEGGRVAAHEVMLATPAIRNLIREDKTAQMVSVMQTGAAVGMQTLDQCLRELVQRGLVSPEAARAKARIPGDI